MDASELRLGNWISVKDRLPEELEWVIGYDSIGKQIRLTRKLEGDNWQMGAFSIKDVSHWMPLPDPPKE